MKYILIAILILSTYQGFCQDNVLSIDQAVEQALKSNASIKAAEYELESQKQLRRTSFELPKTDVTLLYGQYNSYIKNDNNVTISQVIPLSSLGGQATLNRALVSSAELQKAVTENDIVYQVKQVYYQLIYANARVRLLQRQDSIYEGFLKSASARYETGETNQLEQTTAEVQRNETKNNLRQNDTEVSRLKMQLMVLLNSNSMVVIPNGELTAIPYDNIGDTASYAQNPSLSFMRQQIEVATSEKKLQKAKLRPDLLIGVFTQTLIGNPANESGVPAASSNRFTGFQIGLSIPLWFTPQLARIKSAELKRQATESKYDYYNATLNVQLQQAVQQFYTNKNSLNYYMSSALPNSERILRQAQIAFMEGEIGYAEYLLGIRNAISIQESYLKTLNDYNQSVIAVQYLSGNK